MPASVFDTLAEIAINIGIFANSLELHSFLMGSLLPYACLGISMFDKRVAGIVFGLSILVGYGIVPIVPSASVIEAKPWYFVIGSCISSLFVFGILNKSKLQNIVRKGK